MGIPAHIRNAWRKGINPKDNKLFNIYGGLIFLIIGLVILRHNLTYPLDILSP